MNQPMIMNNLFFTITLIAIGLFAITAAWLGSLFVSMVGICIVAVILYKYNKNWE